MKVALTACGLVAACAIAVLALDRPAAAATPPQHESCCAFPDHDHVDPNGFTVRLPTRWQAQDDGHGGLVVNGDQREQLWIVAMPLELALRTRDALPPESESDWTRTVILPHPRGFGVVLVALRAPRAHIASLARRFDTVLRSVRDPQGLLLTASLRFESIAR